MRNRNSRKKVDEETPSNSKSGGGPAPPPNQLSKLFLRLIMGFVMIGSFFSIVWAGHLYLWMLVVVLQVLIFRELVNVRYKAAAEKNIPWFRSVQWCWFGVAMLYNYGDSLHTFLTTNKHNVPSVIVHYLRYNSIISFTLYALLFVMSVLSLKKGYYKYQMGQFTWTVVTLLLTVFQMKYVLTNIFNGLFWLVFPVSLVVCNDCFAYFCGKLFGRRFIKAKFLKLSPNKTWEGFIGAFVCTVVFAFIASSYLAEYNWMVCPLEELQLIPEAITCTPFNVFELSAFKLPPSIHQFTGISEVYVLPIQLHALVFGTFTSLIAPFGGYLASAIKRTYNLKDFDSVIPGHGGVMDRMDCQFITQLFTYVYYGTFIRQTTLTVPVILNLISRLSIEDQQDLLDKLQEYLQSIQS